MNQEHTQSPMNGKQIGPIIYLAGTSLSLRSIYKVHETKEILIIVFQVFQKQAT